MEMPLKDTDVQGLKHFTRLLPLLDKLKDMGCQRDSAGNRKLFFDDYVKLGGQKTGQKTGQSRKIQRG
jgi:hypothetical protein